MLNGTEWYYLYCNESFNLYIYSLYIFPFSAVPWNVHRVEAAVTNWTHGSHTSTNKRINTSAHSTLKLQATIATNTCAINRPSQASAPSKWGIPCEPYTQWSWSFALTRTHSPRWWYYVATELRRSEKEKREEKKKQIYFNKVLWLSNICQANKSICIWHQFSSTCVYMHIECENVKRPQKQTEQFSVVLLKN